MLKDLRFQFIDNLGTVHIPKHVTGLNVTAQCGNAIRLPSNKNRINECYDCLSIANQKNESAK